MKRVLIVGASGSLAKYVIEALLQLSDIKLALFLRNKSRLPKGLPDSLKVIEGNALNYADVKNAVAGRVSFM